MFDLSLCHAINFVSYTTAVWLLLLLSLLLLLFICKQRELLYQRTTRKKNLYEEHKNPKNKEIIKKKVVIRSGIDTPRNNPCKSTSQEEVRLGAECRPFHMPFLSMFSVLRFSHSIRLPINSEIYTRNARL